jgi:transposase
MREIIPMPMPDGRVTFVPVLGEAQVAVLDTSTGELVEQEIAHEGDARLPGVARLVDDADRPARRSHRRRPSADPPVQLLLTHPGVGPLTALTTVLVLGPLARFPDRKHVVSYVGLAPAVHASADKPRLGKITKQGNALLRWVLGQAAPLAARADDDLRRRVMQRRGRPKAKVALARKRLVRLYIMLRDQIDYEEFRRRGRAPRQHQLPVAVM